MRARHTPPSEKRIVRIFFVLCALPFFFVFPYIGAFNNPNENVRTYMTMAVVEDGTFEINDVVRRFGWVNDMAKVPHPDGTFSYYSLKGPANSYAGIPVYWAYRSVAKLFGKTYPALQAPAAEKQAWMRDVTWVLRLFTVQLPCFLFLVWFERYLRRFSSDVVLRLTAVAACGVGSNFLAYTHMFASHSLFAVTAFLAMGLTEDELRRSRGDSRARRPLRAFYAGACAGLVTMLEYHGFPMSVLLAIFGAIVFWRPTRLAAYAAGGLLITAGMAFYQWRAYGDPLTPGHKHAETQAFAAVHAQGIFGVSTPKWEAFSALSFDSGFGFFGTSPYMWLGVLALVLGLVVPLGRAREARLARITSLVWILVMAALWLVNAGKIYWRAGWTVGPRHLGAAPPFFALGAVIALEILARRGKTPRALVRGLSGGLALASVATIGLVGLLIDTLQESFTRPLVQFAIPMVRLGIVPHHIGEWFGWDSTTLWYVAAAAMFAAPLLAGLVWARESRAWRHALRASVLVVACVGGLVPAFLPEANAPPVAGDMRVLFSVWEPPGRDRLSTAMVEAERRGPRGPCWWHRVADLDRILDQEADAVRAESRATAPRTACPRTRF